MTDDRIPCGLGPQRARILEVALAEFDAGVVEVPRGSNRGPQVDRYVPAWARRHPGLPWCSFFACWVLKTALGRVPSGRTRGGCEALRRDAEDAGLWRTRDGLEAGEVRPLPGDLFLMDTDGSRGSRGHVGIVLRVSEGLDTICTVEGNSGHRVRLGVRELADPRIVGFIDAVPDDPCFAFARGLIAGESLSRKSTR